MLQQDQPEDYVIATGETHSVREFAEVAFQELGMKIEWQGSQEKERGVLIALDNKNLVINNKGEYQPPKIGSIVVRVDAGYYRPTEVDFLIGNPEKAREKLGWEPKVKFEELARIMARADLEKVIKKGY